MDELRHHYERRKGWRHDRAAYSWSHPELLQSKEVILFAIELTEDDIQDNTELHIINVLPNMGEIKPLELTLFTMNSN